MPDQPPPGPPKNSELSNELVDDEQAGDARVARVLVHNKIVAQEQIDACMAIIAREAAAGEPRRALVNVLVSEGLLSPKKAGTVEAALRKQRSDRAT
jgi:hypothetical protein